MRDHEVLTKIRTQIIFNNLIKQNQKLSSDSVLKQKMTVYSVQSPVSKVKHPGSSFQHLRPESRNSGMPFFEFFGQLNYTLDSQTDFSKNSI